MSSNRYQHPRRSMGASIFEWLANSKGIATVRRRVLSHLPYLQLQSDVADVVYLTWLVPVDSVRGVVPDSLVLWQRDGLTPFSILTYRHQHFGPRGIGALRRVFASPLQSNWRLYLQEAPPGAQKEQTVFFVHNVLSNPLYVLGARAMSDALPAHWPAKFVHQVSESTYTTEIDPGDGSALPFVARVQQVESAELPAAFDRLFRTWSEAVAFFALQDAAVVEVQGMVDLAYAQIELPIPTAEVMAAQAMHVVCPFVESLGPVGQPLCFIVPKVVFNVRSERLLRCDSKSLLK